MSVNSNTKNTNDTDGIDEDSTIYTTLDECYPKMDFIPFHHCPKFGSVTKKMGLHLDKMFFYLQLMIEQDNLFSEQVKQDKVLFDLFFRIASASNRLSNYQVGTDYKKEVIIEIQNAMKNCLLIFVGQRQLVSQFHPMGTAHILETKIDWKISTKELQFMMK